jgi:YVTN family beta-propeller protein
MTLVLRAGRWLLAVAICATGIAMPSCYTAGSGQPPPTQSLYFPVGLAVSAGGNVLYAVNSDFDLQWNGGTLQSYDLYHIRQDAAAGVAGNVGPTTASCVTAPPPNAALGRGCAPAVDSTKYVEDSVIIGAFATDLELSQGLSADQQGTRLYTPVRGNASLTWADVVRDTPCLPDNQSTCPPPLPVAGAAKAPLRVFKPFALDCGTRIEGRCDALHQAGDDPNEGGNTRHLTLPGEPFGMAQTEDGTAIVVTHQTATETSLLTTGLGSPLPVPGLRAPALQFVLGGLPLGGNGVAVVPHDHCAVNVCDAPPGGDPGACSVTPAGEPTNAGVATDAGVGGGAAMEGGLPAPCVRPAFLQTSHNVPEVDLLRYYDDDGSSQHRPFLQKEAAYSLTANSLGSDSRGIVIDPTPRLACKANLPANASPRDVQLCGQRPARVFFANRTPPSLVVGKIGQLTREGTYDPDALTITGNVSLSPGPAKVYLAPIVNANARVELRVFVVCFDSNSIFIYDPENNAVESVVYTGRGPFAMAFDPMPLDCVAIGDPTSMHWTMAHCPPIQRGSILNSYRFGYVANFTDSYVQLLDLDGSSSSAPYTFEQIVFTLGVPTPPKGQ